MNLSYCVQCMKQELPLLWRLISTNDDDDRLVECRPLFFLDSCKNAPRVELTNLI